MSVRELPLLRADCARCADLCCVVPGFSRSADFAADKPPRTPCPHLGAHHGCTIHDRLRESGYPGCVVYDCFGAGQRVTQETFAGDTWRDEPGLTPRMAEAYVRVRLLHEVLAYLVEARGLPRTEELHDELDRAIERTDTLAGSAYDDLLDVDAEAHRARVAPLLARASELARRADEVERPDHRGADLAGVRWAGRDLRGASLRGSLLVGADLRGADLRGADVTGADLRGADLRGADLRDALFLTAPQLEAAVGDATTRLSDGVRRPAHWDRRRGT